MKKFFILLMIVLMLAGLTSTTFAAYGPPNDNGIGTGKGDCEQIRDPDICGC